MNLPVYVWVLCYLTGIYLYMVCVRAGYIAKKRCERWDDRHIVMAAISSYSEYSEQQYHSKLCRTIKEGSVIVDEVSTYTAIPV